MGLANKSCLHGRPGSGHVGTNIKGNKMETKMKLITHCFSLCEHVISQILRGFLPPFILTLKKRIHVNSNDLNWKQGAPFIFTVNGFYRFLLSGSSLPQPPNLSRNYLFCISGVDRVSCVCD